MLDRRLGLTALYNLVHDPTVANDPDISLMRELHVEVDLATIAAYDWTDLNLQHDFHGFREVTRFSPSPTARIDLLDRLLEENHRRAAGDSSPKSDQTGMF